MFSPFAAMNLTRILETADVPQIHEALAKGLSIQDRIPPEELMPLSLVCRGAAPQALEVVEMLRSRGASWHAIDKYGYTPVQWLFVGHLTNGRCSQVQLDILSEALASFEASPETPWPVGAQGRTLLHAVAGLPDARPLEQMLAAGADVHARDDQGNTPLHAAYRAVQADTATLLVRAGADVAAVNRAGKVPLELLNARHSMRRVDQEAFQLRVVTAEAALGATPSRRRRM